MSQSKVKGPENEDEMISAGPGSDDCTGDRQKDRQTDIDCYKCKEKKGEMFYELLDDTWISRPNRKWHL